MNKRLLLIILFSLFLSERIYPCFCSWAGPFLKVGFKTELVAYIKVLNYCDYSAMEVQIIDLIKGGDGLNKIKVWGTGRVMCRPLIDYFKKSEYWVLALYKSSVDTMYNNEGERYGDYYISECGSYSLEVKKDSVIGKITLPNYNDPPQTMSLTNFLATAKQVLTSINENAVENYSFNLEQNYPNPFNPTTNISYSLKEDSFVKLKIYNLIGEEVRVLIDGNQRSGKYTVEFTALNLPSGFYFYRIQAGNSYQAARKMLLLK